MFNLRIIQLFCLVLAEASESALNLTNSKGLRVFVEIQEFVGCVSLKILHCVHLHYILARD